MPGREIPKATNNTKSLFTFEHRNLYADTSHLNLDAPPPVDMWYDKVQYGRIDDKGFTIIPIKEKIKALHGTDSAVFALDFVADAYKDMWEYWRYLKRTLHVTSASEASVYYNMQAVKGWYDSDVPYDAWIQSLYRLILSNAFLSRDRDQRIVNFGGFLNVVFDLVRKITPSRAMTYSGFVGSNLCSPLCSGLMIELSKDKHGNDRNKVVKYLEDANYELFAEVAKRYGFVLDKNAPWRLVADLTSPGLKPYLAGRRLSTLNEVFSNRYSYVMEHDMDLLRETFVGMYKDFLNREPCLVVHHIQNDTVTTEKVKRVDDSDDFNNWWRVYVYIKARETNRSWDQDTFDTIARITESRDKLIDRASAISYLQKKLREDRGSQETSFEY
jgi:hypothetical protein